MSVTSGTYASRPSSHSAGDIYLTTDSFWDYLVSDGTKWRHLYSGFECEPPIDSEFSWVNQGGASVSTVNGGVFLRVPTSATTNIRARVKTAPATPYTLTGLFLPTMNPALYSVCGLLFRNAASGKMTCIEFSSVLVGVQGDYRVSVRRMNSETSYESVQFWDLLYIHVSSPGLWLQLDDDGTDLHYRFSQDGQNFIEVLSQPRTTFFGTAPDQLGFFVAIENATYDAGATLIHWSQPNPIATMRAFGLFGVLPAFKPSGNVFGAFG